METLRSIRPREPMREGGHPPGPGHRVPEERNHSDAIVRDVLEGMNPEDSGLNSK